MTHDLALYTFGLFLKPSADPANDGFHTLNDRVLERVDRASGLIARSGYDGEAGPDSWGIQQFPVHYVETGDGCAPSTLSLWKDVESAMAFSYFGLHKEALKQGRLWNVKPSWPPYAVWWVEAGHRPDWAEAVARHAELERHGPAPAVFDFKTVFSPDGQAIVPDRERMKRIAEANMTD
ncbi:MAG: DUF3291 domain-containing protein [Rhizobiaceae bacterium]